MNNTQKVKVFSTQACPYCHMAKNFLKKNNIEYEDLDVASNSSAAREMIQKSGQHGVPVIEINNEILVGFNPRAMTELLDL